MCLTPSMYVTLWPCHWINSSIRFPLRINNSSDRSTHWINLPIGSILLISSNQSLVLVFGPLRNASSHPGDTIPIGSADHTGQQDRGEEGGRRPVGGCADEQCPQDSGCVITHFAKTFGMAHLSVWHATLPSSLNGLCATFVASRLICHIKVWPHQGMVDSSALGIDYAPMIALTSSLDS